jgi:hypothetical protein
MNKFIDWKPHFNSQVVVKINNCEKNLNSPINELIRKWIINERLSNNDISLKMDISRPQVDKLIKIFNLNNVYKANIEYKRQINKNKFHNSGNTYNTRTSYQ